MSLISIAILAPFSFAVLILIMRRLPEVLSIIAILIGLIASGMLLSETSNGIGSEIFWAGLPDFPLQLIATPLTALLSTMVALISCFVLVYAIGYMKADPEKSRFFATLLFFISAMQVLVLAGDWILLLSAWELIGLSSYLLIGFWYRKPGVKMAATRAFIVTRSADLGLYIAAFILISSSGSSNIEYTLNTDGNAAIIAGLLLLIAAMGKSAQTPLHNWLQQAMAGPTPVSALLHSATLVAAGAILLIRTAPMLPSETLFIIGIIGGVTTVVTGLIALAESDLKRMLAASTSSQYGLMLVAVGAGVPLAALLHLIAHAAIKSSLFLGAGVFQHNRGSTEFNKLEGVGRDQPKIFFAFTLAALALAGIPPLSGFFSKDAIIAAALNSTYGNVLLPFATAGTLLTGGYMARMLHVLWNGKAKGLVSSGIVWMGLGLTSLVSIAVLLGFAFPTIELLLSTALPDNTQIQYLPEALGLIAALSGLVLGWFIPVKRLLGPLRPWAKQSFAIAGGFDNIMVRPVMALARSCEKLERRLYESVLSVGRFGLSVAKLIRRSDDQGIDVFIFSFVKNTMKLGARARTLQSGFIHKELAITTIVSTVILVFMLLSLLV